MLKETLGDDGDDGNDGLMERQEPRETRVIPETLALKAMMETMAMMGTKVSRASKGRRPSGADSTDDQTASEVNIDSFDGTGNLSSSDTTVQDALDTIDGLTLGGGGAVSVVAIAPEALTSPNWYTSSWGQWSGSLTSSVNDGSFTLSTDTNQKVIVPEDGVYEVTAVMYLNANNDDSGGTDFRPMLRIRREPQWVFNNKPGPGVRRAHSRERR